MQVAVTSDPNMSAINPAKTYLSSVSSRQSAEGTQGGDTGSSKSSLTRGIFMSLFIFTWVGFFTVSIMKKETPLLLF